MMFQVLGVELGIKNRLKLEAQHEVPLSINFVSILMDCEKQVGMENRAKSDPKWIGKRIEKMIKQKCVGNAFWVDEALARGCRAAWRGAESWTP